LKIRDHIEVRGSEYNKVVKSEVETG